MAVAIPLVALIAAEVGGVAITAGMVAGAAVAFAGAAMENKDLQTAGAVISLGSGLLSGAATEAGSQAAGEAAADATAQSATSEMAQGTVAGTDPTASTGLAGAQTAAEAAPEITPVAADAAAAQPLAGAQANLAGQPTTESIAPSLAGEMPNSLSPAQSNLAGGGLINSQMNDSAAMASLSGEQMGPPKSAMMSGGGGGLIDSIIGWGKSNPLLASTAVNVGGKFIEKGFSKDPNQERLKFEREKQGVELQLLREQLARKNAMPGTMPFTFNKDANLFPNGTVGVPRPVGMINGNMG